MSESTSQHRREAPRTVRCAVITVSDTRTLETDEGGRMIVDGLQAAEHIIVCREIVPDDPDVLSQLVSRLADDSRLDAILITGGTGIAARDQTYEAIERLLTKMLPGYGELFRYLSYDEIGPAAMLSRAIGGLVGRVVVLTMPGSRAAVRLALEKLILPELGHLVYEARK